MTGQPMTGQPVTVPPIHVIVPVWGAAYTRCFLDVGLPSLLAPGNLPALDRDKGNVLHILTTKADREVIEQEAVWQRARAVLDCRVDILAGAANEIREPHRVMSDCHRMAIQYGDSRSAAMVFYNPDVVMADGGMQSLVRLLAAGKRAVQTVGLRLFKDDAVPLLLAQHLAADGVAVTVSPRALMAIAMRHLHPITMMHMQDNPESDLLPQELFWRAGDEGLVARCFHIHPILVYPRNRNAPFTTTIDYDYLRAACPDPADEHVVIDSDEFCVCELSGLQRQMPGLKRTYNGRDIATWAWSSAQPYHLEHFCRRIFLHAGRSDAESWAAACARSDAAVAQVFKHLLALQAGAALT